MTLFKKSHVFALTLASVLFASQSALACRDLGVRVLDNGRDPFRAELRVHFNGFTLGNQTYTYDHSKRCWGSFTVGGSSLRCLGKEVSSNSAYIFIDGKTLTLNSRGTAGASVVLTASKQNSGKSEFHAMEAVLGGNSLLVRNDINAPQNKGGAPAFGKVDLGKRGNHRKTGNCTKIEKVAQIIGAPEAVASPAGLAE